MPYDLNRTIFEKIWLQWKGGGAEVVDSQWRNQCCNRVCRFYRRQCFAGQTASSGLSDDRLKTTELDDNYYQKMQINNKSFHRIDLSFLWSCRRVQDIFVPTTVMQNNDHLPLNLQTVPSLCIFLCNMGLGQDSHGPGQHHRALWAFCQWPWSAWGLQLRHLERLKTAAFCRWNVWMDMEVEVDLNEIQMKTKAEPILKQGLPQKHFQG